MIKINQTEEFQEWVASLALKEQLKLLFRLENIKNFGHFGDAKPIGKDLAELRWKNGWRVYFLKRKKVYNFIIKWRPQK